MDNITPAGTDFSKWQRSNLERLAVELTAEVLRLRAELAAERAEPSWPEPKPMQSLPATYAGTVTRPVFPVQPEDV